MEMSQGFNSFRMTPLASLQLRRSRGAAIYIHPDDVAGDPDLPLAEKRALLASWISDARAVENAPSLRRLDSGAVVEVDAILRALVLLDDVAPARREDFERVPLSSRRRGLPPRLAPTTMMTTLRQPRQVSEFRFVPNPCRRPMARVLTGRLS